MISFQGPLRLFVGVLGFTGVSSAVATPIIFYVKSDSPTGRAGGGYQGVTPASVTKCTTNPPENLKTYFGASDVSDVCWQGDNVTKETEFNEFFKTKWSNPNIVWRDIQGRNGWVQQCQSSTPNWIIWDNNSETEDGRTDKEELLGLCDSSKAADSTLFVKRDQKGGTITLSICESQCWEMPNNKRDLQAHKESSFKKVDFYKRVIASA